MTITASRAMGRTAVPRKNVPRAIGARLFALLTALSLLCSPLLAAEGTPLPVPMAKADSLQSGGSPGGSPVSDGDQGEIADGRVIPEPKERILVPRPRSGVQEFAFTAAASAGVGGGLALTAWGLSTLFRGAGNGFDAAEMHQGLTIAVSGSLVVSLFTVLAERWRSRSEQE